MSRWKLRPCAVRVGLAACLLGLALATPVSAALIPISGFDTSDSVITFETGSTALPTIPGVSFRDNAITVGQYGGDATFGNLGYGKQYYGNLSGPEGYSNLRIDFSTPQPAVGAFLVRGDPALQTTVYDAAGNVEETTTTASSFNLQFVGFTEPQGISSIEWSYLPGQGTFFGVDDVVYGSTAVPEPTTAAMACLLPLVLLYRRRTLLGA